MKWFPDAIKQLKECPKDLRGWLIAWMFFRTAMKFVGTAIGGAVVWYLGTKLHLK